MAIQKGESMNKLELKKGILTTNHPASSYGIPVYYLDGIAYGPSDRPPGALQDHMVADLVVSIAEDQGLTAPQLAFVERFLTPAPMFSGQLARLRAIPVRGPGKPSSVGGEVALPPVRVPAEINTALRELAKANNVSLSEVIRRGVMLLLEKEK